VANLEAELRELDVNAEYRTCTGVLASHPQSRDLKIYNFSVSFYGCELLTDTLLELNAGNRYGLIGLNGSGKSTLLAVLGRREVPIPLGLDIFHLHREMPPVDKTALQCVMEVEEERMLLEKEAEELAHSSDDRKVFYLPLAHDLFLKL
jgi:ATP-binding cassette, subfamily F, member 2